MKNNEKTKGQANGLKLVSQKELSKIMKRKGIDESQKKSVDGSNYNRGQDDF